MKIEMSYLAERVRRLEHQNRVMKWSAAGILLLVAVTSLTAQQRPVRTVEAEKFVLLDSKGRARVTIGIPQSSGVANDTAADEPSIWISDANGMDRVIITTEGLRLANEAGRPAASLTFTNNKGAQILLQSGDGQPLYHAPCDFSGSIDHLRR
jgi:myo-inositol-hexaphosphate 3-phosphohydrolase